MDVKVFNNNPMATNTYIINTPTRETAILDPVGNINTLLHYIEMNHLDVKYIILTHGHADHIGLVSECKKATGAPLVAHIKEEEMLNDKSLNLSTMFHNPMEFSSDIQVKDGQEIPLGNLILSVIHTPGHTPGSICILVEDNLFTGDTVFKGSIGRTDFPGGDYNKIQESIKKIIALDPKLTLYPGHGESSILKYEIESNPYFQK